MITTDQLCEDIGHLQMEIANEIDAIEATSEKLQTTMSSSRMRRGMLERFCSGLEGNIRRLRELHQILWLKTSMLRKKFSRRAPNAPRSLE